MDILAYILAKKAGTAGDGSSSDLYNTSLSLTDAQKGKAKENLGISDGLKYVKDVEEYTDPDTGNKKTNLYSVIEGDINSNTTSDYYAHAEGYNTSAGGYCAHAEGYRTKVTNAQAHAEGCQTEAAGYCAHTEGYNTKATESYAHAEGNGTKATFSSCHAEGDNTEASTGYGAHAEGGSTKATAQCAHAEGYMATASSSYSHAEGYDTKATGTANHAEGWQTEANSFYTHAEGGYSKANGSFSHAEGNMTIASGGNSHAEGYHTESAGNASHAEGTSSSTGSSSGPAHAEGYTTEALGYASHTEGSNTKTGANGAYAHAEGWYTQANGAATHAEGDYSVASGSYSHAEGYETITRGPASHAEGHDTIANKRDQHVFGAFNIAEELDPNNESSSAGEKGQYIEIVGNGENNNTRSNARTLDWSGNEVLAGKLTVGVGPTNAMDVATKQYVDSGRSNVFSGDVKMMAYVREGTLLSGLANGLRETERNKNLIITYPILISTAAAANGTTRNDFLMSGIIDLSKTNGAACEFTSYKVVYLKGTVDGITFTTDATTLFTQDFEDGYSYLLLGYAINENSIFLYPYHPVYKRIGNATIPYGGGTIGTSLTLGSTTITEAQLQALLATLS